MFSDESNLAYFHYLQSILSEVQTANKNFAVNTEDPCKLHSDLKMLISSLMKKAVPPTKMVYRNALNSEHESSIDPKTRMQSVQGG